VRSLAERGLQCGVAAQAGEGERREFREVAGRFATGVAVATSWVDSAPVGMTINSFTTVSLQPILVLICLTTGSRLTTAISRSRRFAITVLASDQRETARWFATHGRPAGRAQFANAPYIRDSVTGCPLLSDGVAYFGCASYRHHAAGDHVVVIGRVRSWGMLRPLPPLVFVDGRYGEQRAEGE
jgi:flavin reductase